MNELDYVLNAVQIWAANSFWAKRTIILGFSFFLDQKKRFGAFGSFSELRGSWELSVEYVSPISGYPWFFERKKNVWKIFGNNSCPITDSVPGAQSGWCGIFGNYFLKEAKFENPFGGSAFGVGNSQNDGITSCVLCNRSPYCSGSETNKKYKLMWWHDNKMQDFTIIAPN